MNGLRHLVEQLRLVILGVTAALMPSPEGQRLANRWGVDAAAFSIVLGFVEAAGGGLLWFFGGVAAVTGTSPLLGMTLLENWFPGLDPVHFMGAGLLALATWLVHPLAWLLALIGLTGAVRIIAFVANREAVGEPVVWAVVRLGQLTIRGTRTKRRVGDLGPPRPDRLQYEGISGLRIVSSRDRPEWGDGTTLEVDGRFFAYVGASDVRDGMYGAVRYEFTELEPNEVLRNPQPYRPLTVSAATTRGGTKPNGD